MAQIDFPDEIIRLLGRIITGTVIAHEDYGFYMDIDMKYVGLVQIIDIVEEGGASRSCFPEIGTKVKAVVIGFKKPNQVALSIKSSVIKDADSGELD